MRRAFRSSECPAEACPRCRGLVQALPLTSGTRRVLNNALDILARGRERQSLKQHRLEDPRRFPVSIPVQVYGRRHHRSGFDDAELAFVQRSIESSSRQQLVVLADLLDPPLANDYDSVCGAY